MANLNSISASATAVQTTPQVITQQQNGNNLQTNLQNLAGQSTQNQQQQQQQTQIVDREKLMIYQWVNELTNAETRENALLELSKKREVYPELAPMLWYDNRLIHHLKLVFFYLKKFIIKLSNNIP